MGFTQHGAFGADEQSECLTHAERVIVLPLYALTSILVDCHIDLSPLQLPELHGLSLADLVPEWAIESIVNKLIPLKSQPIVPDSNPGLVTKLGVKTDCIPAGLILNITKTAAIKTNAHTKNCFWLAILV